MTAPLFVLLTFNRSCHSTALGIYTERETGTTTHRQADRLTRNCIVLYLNIYKAPLFSSALSAEARGKRNVFRERADEEENSDNRFARKKWERSLKGEGLTIANDQCWARAVLIPGTDKGLRIKSGILNNFRSKALLRFGHQKENLIANG